MRRGGDSTTIVLAVTDPATAASPGSRLRLVLASGSPRRWELLDGLGIHVVVRPVDIDETLKPDESPEVYVLRLAREKAKARGKPGEVVLAADTIVAVDGRLLGKPKDEGEARRMLRDLSGREHEVLTGIAVWVPGEERLESDVETTRVRFAALSEEEIVWYAASGEPRDKAGAYGIQGLGALLVEAISGNYSNVVGLPLPRVYRLLAEVGVDLKKLTLQT